MAEQIAFERVEPLDADLWNAAFIAFRKATLDPKKRVSFLDFIHDWWASEDDDDDDESQEQTNLKLMRFAAQLRNPDGNHQ